MAAGILVPFSGSRKSERALAAAVSAARATNVPLRVLVLAAVEDPSRCCNLQTTSWNAELRRLAAEDANRASALLPDDVDWEVVVREGQGRGAVRRVAAELGCTVATSR